MSMISGLIDKLNKSADEWNASNMFELARMCREAADTIWQLRDDLQRANAENAKLREELADAPKCETCEAMLDCDECLRADGSHKERRRLSAENAKLRELVRDMWRTMGLLNACDVSEYDEPLNCIYCEQWGTVGKNIIGCKLMYRMDELRIETD